MGWLLGRAFLADEIARGNLNVNVKLASDKDQLGKALQLMTEKLNDIISQILEQVSGSTSVRLI